MFQTPQISSAKKVVIYLFLMGIVIGPFLILAFFTHPLPGDDYHHALRALELSHGEAVLESYLTWTGRYFLCWALTFRSLFHSAIVPCQLVLFFLMISFPIVIFFLIKQYFKSIDTGRNIFFTLLLTFLYFYNLPSQDEGLFWFTGAIAYQVPNLLSIVYIIVISGIDNTIPGKPIRTSLLVLLAILLIVAIAGCNEISMAVLLIFNFLFLANQFYVRSDKRYIILLLVFISIASAATVYFAPGNNVRESLFPDKYNFAVTIYMSILGAAYYILQWIFMTIILSIIAIPFIKEYAPLTSRFFKVSPLITLSSWIIIIAVAFLVPAWATGQMPNPRAINVIFLLFILGWFYNLIIFIDYLTKKGYEIPVLPPVYLTCLFIIILAITFNSSSDLNNNIKYAYKDLISGKALKYSKQMYQYREDVRQSNVPIFPNLSDKPVSFSKYVEGDSLEIKEILSYYHLKDKLFK